MTSSVSGKRATAAPIARALLQCCSCYSGKNQFEVETGFEPVWTALQAAASPLGHSTAVFAGAEKVPAHRADDGIRTRDPHLGKVMLYH